MYHLKQQINKSIKNKDKKNEEITILTFKISKNISLLLLEKLRLTFSQIKVWYTIPKEFSKNLSIKTQDMKTLMSIRSSIFHQQSQLFNFSWRHTGKLEKKRNFTCLFAILHICIFDSAIMGSCALESAESTLSIPSMYVAVHVTQCIT